MNATSISVEQIKSNAKSATLAYAGLYVAAVDAASKFGDNVVAKAKTANTDFGKKVEDLNSSGSKLFGELVSRGEQVEADAKTALEDISLPKVELPKIELPESISSLELPKVEMPKAIAELELPKSVSDIKLPKAVTEFKLPEAVSEVVEKVKSKVSK